jgi:4'-phosphopantetheinyl transferase
VRERPQLEALARALDPAELARGATFRFDRHRDEFVACRGTLRALVGAYTARPARSIAFGYSSTGKPYLAKPGDLRFNVTHSGDLALIAFTRGRELGVDIEQYRDLDLLAVAKTSFSEHEQAVLSGLPEPARRDAFFSCWSRKEAFLKATGVGLKHLADFDVTLHPEPARLLRVVGPFSREWTIYDLPATDGHAQALAAAGAVDGIDCFDWLA